MARCSSYCGLADDPFFIRTTAKHTARVLEWHECSDAVKELTWDVSKDRRSRKNICSKFFMAISTIESELGGCQDIKILLLTSPAWPPGVGGRAGPLWRIKQAPEEIQGKNTQCEHSEKECEVVETLTRRDVDVCCIQETRCLGGNCRTIKGKDTLVQTLLVRKRQRSACGGRVDKKSV